MTNGSKTIHRVYGDATGRALATRHGGLVYAVAYDPSAAPGITAQTENALSFLDGVLRDAGASKSTLLQATVYLRDIAEKAPMDAVWNAWIGPRENWPQRACVEADTGQGSLIEIVVIAAEDG